MRAAFRRARAWAQCLVSGRKRSLVLGVLAVLAVNLSGIGFVTRPDPNLGGFENHDARIIVGRIAANPDPVAWFTGDWPLGNGFYRPLPTVLYWLDLQLWGRDYSPYRVTNGVLVSGAALLMLWALTAWGMAWWVAVACAALMAAWQSDLLRALPVETFANWSAAVLAVSSLGYSGARRWQLIGAAALIVLLGRELAFEFFTADLHGKSFGYRAMGWIPGRTASLAAIFAWLSIGCFARFASTRRGTWGIGCVVACGCALASYEAAVMIPPVLTLASRWWLGSGSKRHATLLTTLWTVALAFTLWHFLALDKGTAYLQARDRSFTSTALGLGTWLFPALSELNALRSTVIEPDVWPGLLVLGPFWAQVGVVIASLLGWWIVLRRTPRLMGVLVSSTLLYAPMAMQLPLMHYAYLGATVRTVFVVGLVRLLTSQIHRPTHRFDFVVGSELTQGAARKAPT